VLYHDPHCPEIEINGETLRSCSLTAENIRAADVCLVLTDHSNVDYDAVLENAQRILDTRNVLKGSKASHLTFL
jgi:UDP-N-acetyl-D-glucosamine dehydrogenase